MKNFQYIVKVFVLFIVFISGIIIESKAQSNWEVGVRFGDDIALDATVPLAAAPRLHPAIYFNPPSDYGDFGIAGYFDWMFSLSGGPQGLKFYPGVGPEFFFGDDFNFHIAGNFGAEYSFQFPLTVALDWRPGFEVTNGFEFKSGNWGISARFRFGEGVKFQRE